MAAAATRIAALIVASLAALASPLTAQAKRTDGIKAFAIEAAGGIAGSALGFGVIVMATEECTGDFDLVACAIGPSAAALALSTVGSAAGAILAGQTKRTEPSLAGAIVGAVVGAGAAVGTYHLFREELDVNVGQGATVLIVAVTQGLVTAATSRLFVSLRR